MDEPVAFQLQERTLNRRTRYLQDLGNRPFEKNEAGRQDAFGDVATQNVLGNFVAALGILAEAWLAHAVGRLPFGWQFRPLSLRHLPGNVTAENKCILHTRWQIKCAFCHRIWC
ncbi:hypothetical protein D3C71_1926500 [compost metagenome]